LKPFTLSFVPPDDLMELFREDYIRMQGGMIYGESPDFETMIDQLRLLNGRFRVIGEGRTLEEIIAKATPDLNSLEGPYKDGAIASLFVEYWEDANESPSPSNRTVTYKIHFIRRKVDWTFHSIEISNPFLSHAM
ncbi:MAG TPA: hypothetical protein VNE41_05445, partial [Chitinophagaceae bacterium]|nr:hypothetical protein [Chitinophagaceae bacterium]